MGSTIAYLPVPVENLPGTVRKFASASAPRPARMMAAKGMVPVRGPDLLTLLCQLANDDDREISDTAKSSLELVPDEVLIPACGGLEFGPAIHAISEFFGGRSDVLMQIIDNRQTPDHTLVAIGKRCNEQVSERLALDQQRLIKVPRIIESLYNNPNTRMSTADRLVELAVRHDLDLSGIPAFKAHAEAIKGQLIPEPMAEALPGDAIFAASLAADSDEDAVKRPDDDDGTEEVKKDFKPLSFRISEMNIAEKIRLAAIGDAAARSLLVRDPNRLVCLAAISSPKMREKEAAAVALSKEVSEDVLRYIGNKKKWARNYEIKRGLMFNPKTPMGIALRFLGHLRDNDMKALVKSRGVRGGLKTAATARLRKKKKD